LERNRYERWSDAFVETGEKSCRSSFLVDEERESTGGVKAGQDRFSVILANWRSGEEWPGTDAAFNAAGKDAADLGCDAVRALRAVLTAGAARPTLTARTAGDRPAKFLMALFEHHVVVINGRFIIQFISDV
jgi:hypothetical protein